MKGKGKRSLTAPAVVTMSATEMMELRLLATQQSAVEAMLRQLIATRDARLIAIAAAHGIDATQGRWHFDADSGRIEPHKE